MHLIIQTNTFHHSLFFFLSAAIVFFFIFPLLNLEGGGSEEAEVDAPVALSLRGHAQPRVEDQFAERGLRVVVERHPAVGSADGAAC